MFTFVTQKQMATSQAAYVPLPKAYPFSNQRKVMFPQGKLPDPNSKTGKEYPFDMNYHVDVLMKYSKNIPKREKSALDMRHSESDLKFYNNTTKFGGTLAKG